LLLLLLLLLLSADAVARGDSDASE